MKRTDEDVSDRRLPGFLVGQKVFVRFETGESNGHFGHDTRKDGAETLVERQWCFPLNNLDSGSNEPSWFRLIIE